MLESSQERKNVFIIFIFLVIILLCACESRQEYVGLYRAGEDNLQHELETTIELKEDGQGVWRVDDDEASFSWGLNGKEIRLHTKTGGVIKGVIKNNGIEIILPNSKNMFFTKIK